MMSFLEAVRKYWALITALFLLVGNGFVQAYQVIELSKDMDGVQAVQKEQARTKVDIEYIQKDVENMQDDVKENKELLIKILNKLEN